MSGTPRPRLPVPIDPAISGHGLESAFFGTVGGGVFHAIRRTAGRSGVGREPFPDAMALQQGPDLGEDGLPVVPEHEPGAVGGTGRFLLSLLGTSPAPDPASPDAPLNLDARRSAGIV